MQLVKRRAFPLPFAAMAQSNDIPDTRLTREERLAAKLRENLRRRKTQSREMQDNALDALPKADDQS